MTCAVIAEKGFICPKLERGECECKSPAALCYKPMTANELLILLNSFEISGSAIEKIKTIKEFIQDYLYNVEPVIAETVINYEVKERFSLKAGDIVPLIKLHREIYKKYIDGKETRRETEGTELPDWYESTERGGLRFIPGLLADHMARNVAAFYGAGSYYFYETGVYTAQDDLSAQAKVREHLVPRYATMTAITDTMGQWRMQIMKPVREINCNPFIVVEKTV